VKKESEVANQPGQTRKWVAEKADADEWDAPQPIIEVDAWLQDGASALADEIGDARTVELEAGDAGPGWDFADPMLEELSLDAVPAIASWESGELVATLKPPPVRKGIIQIPVASAEGLASESFVPEARCESHVGGSSRREAGQLLLLPLAVDDAAKQSPGRIRRVVRLPRLPGIVQIELLFRAEALKV
jgi:hypothetical protein